MKTRNQFTRGLNALLAGAILALAAASWAADEPFDRLVNRWKAEREQLLRRMTQLWLKGEKPESMKGDLLNLSQLESGLATRPGGPLYLAGVDNPNHLNATVGGVVRAYLKNRGATVNSANFFRGKTFVIVLPSQASPAIVPPPAANGGAATGAKGAR
jgi:hypothetical protein